MKTAVKLMAIRRCLAYCLLVGFALLAGTAWAFIERLTPLANLLEDADFVFVAKIEKVDPEKPSMVLQVDADLKGKAPFRRLPILLTGDKEKHTAQLLERVGPEASVVVFVTELNKKQLALAYINGTWFQVLGEPDGQNVRWSFTHAEIYLRRTYKGSTPELIATVKDALSGRKPPPAPDSKEPPGFGPKLEQN